MHLRYKAAFPLQTAQPERFSIFNSMYSFIRSSIQPIIGQYLQHAWRELYGEEPDRIPVLWASAR